MSDSYSRRVGFILALVAEAKKDFPELDENNVEVQVYAGTSRKRTIGIEFRADDMPIPDFYYKVDGLEERY